VVLSKFLMLISLSVIERLLNEVNP
jgi:hypothetical protein